MKFLITALFAISLGTHAAVPNGHAEIKSAKGSITGHVQVIPIKNHLRIIAEINGLKPGSAHGFHIHEKGKCEGPDYNSAGGHLSPEKDIHGGPAANVRHLGDLGNVVADKNGTARTDVVIQDLRPDLQNAVFGKSVILHEKADDLASQPSGDAGGRLACGVIEKGELKKKL